MRLWIRRIVSGLVLIALLAAGAWWAGLDCETRAVTTLSGDATPNAPRTWTDFRIPNLARVVVVDAGWDRSVVELEEVLWVESTGGSVTEPIPGTTIEVDNPIRHRGCSPKAGERFVVASEAGVSAVGWLRIHPDGSLTVEGGVDPELDQRVFAASAADGVLDPEAMIAFAADLAILDRSTVRSRIEAGELLDRRDGTTHGPMDAAMVENLAVLAERDQQPNW